jgi:glycosyltransferase involved in cell wall biosynthesis
VRILQVAGSATGGVARHVEQVATELADAGQDVRIAAPRAVRERIGVPGVELDLRDRPSAADARTVATLRTLAAGADVVHAHGLRAGALTVLAVRSLRARPRVVVTEHNLAVGSRRTLAISGVLERLVARGADVVLAVAPDLANRARRLGARDVRLAVVPAPPRRPATADREEVRASLSIPDGVALVVCVSRLAPQKGHDLLVEAAALTERTLAGRPLPGDGPAPHDDAPRPTAPATAWCVAGSGPLRNELAEHAVSIGAPVRLLGAREDVPDLLAAADVVVSTSHWDGQTIVLQEAMAAGAAVVATDVGGVSIVTGEAGILTARDAREVSDAVVQILTDVGLSKRLKAAALRRSSGLATGADLAAQLRDVYGPTER